MDFQAFTDAKGNLQTEAAQEAALEAFIGQDKYLRKHRGEYTSKYAGTTPWFSQLDMRILQDFNFKGSSNTLQLSVDFVNFGNLISSKWGVRKYASATGYYQPLTYAGLSGDKAVYQFDPSQTKTFISSPDLPSRWQLQVGIRYIF
jgi:hypothetical protein